MMILPIHHLISKSKIIRPLRILSQKINVPQKRDPTNDFLFPKTLGYSDDLSVLTFADLDSTGVCPQVEYLNDIHQKFERISGLKLNIGKSVLFSSNNNPRLQTIADKYSIRNVSGELLKHLGFYIQPNKYDDPHVSINQITQKVTKAAATLRSSSILGRKVLINSLCLPYINYHCQSWFNLKVTDLD